MDGQIWSWLLTIVGVTGFWLAGKKVWWCWYINIANQFLWATYAIVTEQWGFFVGVVFYLTVFISNAYEWTVEHHLAKAREERVEHIESVIRRSVMTPNEVRVHYQNDARPYYQFDEEGRYCGHLNPLDAYPYKCTRPLNHLGEHGYAGVYWDNEE